MSVAMINTSLPMPEAVSFLISEVSELKNMLGAAQKPNENKRRLPIGIDEVCVLTAKAKPTIYALVRKRIIPCYKSSKKLYFYEDEIIAWIEGGKRKTKRRSTTTIKIKKMKKIKKTKNKRVKVSKKRMK